MIFYTLMFCLMSVASIAGELTVTESKGTHTTQTFAAADLVIVPASASPQDATFTITGSELLFARSIGDATMTIHTQPNELGRTGDIAYTFDAGDTFDNHAIFWAGAKAGLANSANEMSVTFSDDSSFYRHVFRLPFRGGLNRIAQQIGSGTFTVKPVGPYPNLVNDDVLAATRIDDTTSDFWLHVSNRNVLIGFAQGTQDFAIISQPDAMGRTNDLRAEINAGEMFSFVVDDSKGWAASGNIMQVTRDNSNLQLWWLQIP